MESNIVNRKLAPELSVYVRSGLNANMPRCCLDQPSNLGSLTKGQLGPCDDNDDDENDDDGNSFFLPVMKMIFS